MWAALESMAARLTTLLASDEDVARLRHIFDDFGESTPANYIEEYSDANIAFPQALVELSKSPVLIETIKNIFVHVRAIRRMTIERRARSPITYASSRHSKRAIPNVSSSSSDSIPSILPSSSILTAIFSTNRKCGEPRQKGVAINHACF
jgi:hypothetical protein